MNEVFPPVRIETMTLGEAWIAIAAAILKDGVEGSWEGLPIVEVFRATLDVRSPAADDPIIAQHGDPEPLPPLHANFPAPPRGGEIWAPHRLAAPPVRLRPRGPRPDPMGDRQTGRQSIGARRDRHDVPATNRHQLHPMRQPARLLACQG